MVNNKKSVHAHPWLVFGNFVGLHSKHKNNHFCVSFFKLFFFVKQLLYQTYFCRWNNQTYLDCRPDMELYGSRYYNIVSVMSTFGFPLLIQSYCYYSVIRCLLSKDTVTISQACRRHNREMKRVRVTKICCIFYF